MGTGNSTPDVGEQVDLAAIVDMNFLKGMAYDRMVGIQQLQGELQMINGRIADLQQNPVIPDLPVEQTNGKLANQAS
jgi:hypothetical protein